ncbi:Pathogenesis-related transcriptional factor and ERF protein [Limibacter armeniacum]|uniref:Pathogenesis-related transcriptional factor and ERF protein n=1 Tax=Limibacter armeniacum TaxID=466084 RepID=UPI002FE620F5
MLVKLQLKNSPKEVIVDDFVYDYLRDNPYLKSLDFIHNLREHSSGRAVFQKSWKQKSGKYKTETIYLHKLVAEKFLEKENTRKGDLVKIINGNRLDCRVKNLEWSNRSDIKRNIGSTRNKTGYIGVFKDRYNYRAVIYKDRKPIPLGSFKTAEEAALAYNNKSIELFGKTKSLNKIKTSNIKGNTQEEA